MLSQPHKSLPTRPLFTPPRTGYGVTAKNLGLSGEVKFQAVHQSD